MPATPLPMRGAHLLFAGIAVCLALLSSRATAEPGPPREGITAVHTGFVVENLVGADTPTCMAFLPDGSFLVGEKKGRVYYVKHGVKQQPALWNAELEVLNALDRGLLGIAVDPDFMNNRRVYFLYVVDPDTNGLDSDGFGFGRLTRYSMVAPDSNALDPASRTILMGQDRTVGPVIGHGSHTIGALRWGVDGSLLVSIGDGANFVEMDDGGLDSASFGPGRADPDEDIGAFRAQDVNSLSGKILRIDPATGHGLPDNPFFNGDPSSDRSKVWLYGLRNAFRFSIRPGTGSATPGALHPGTLYIGDVGWNSFEELNVARNPGMNFGWPCYEGPQTSAPYQAGNPAHHGCATLPPTPPITLPLHHWRETAAASNLAGVLGTCVIDGVFYTGNLYPAEFQGAHFFSDFGYSWIRVARFDSDDHIQTLVDLASYVGEVVDFASDPLTGDIHFVSVRGAVARIRYTGPPNERPMAMASADVTSGFAPLDIEFSSAGSFDPGGGPISRTWSFGDGQFSTDPNPTHTFAGGGSYSVMLTVQDSNGWIDRDTVVIVVEGPDPFPATAVRDRFVRPDGPLGGGWIEPIGSHVIENGAVASAVPGASQAVWGAAVFAPDQEVFATLRDLPSSGTCALLLKVQGVALASGGLEVRYDPSVSTVVVSEHVQGSGTQIVGTRTGITFAPGDRLGARTYVDGRVDVFRNTSRIGAYLLGPGTLRTQSGRIGFGFDASMGGHLDEVGGGSLLPAGQNTIPTATILAPEPSAFRAPGDTVWLRGTGSDAEDPDSLLSYEWTVDLHHAAHVHPDYYVSNVKETFFVMEEHGTSADFTFEVRFSVTDVAGGRREVSGVVHPAVDLSVGTAEVTPVPAGSGAPIHIECRLYNVSGIDAPSTRWQMMIDSTLVGEGEIAIARHDSAQIAVDVPAGVPAGTRVVRVYMDALDALLEPDEDNNSLAQFLVVVPGVGPDTHPPGIVPAPSVERHGTYAIVTWGTDEPAFGKVRFGATPSLAESVTTLEGTDHEVELDGLSLATRYYYRVVATDPSGNSTVAPLDSFVTTSGTLEATEVPTDRLELYPASRNPTSGSARFMLALPRAAPVELRVYDLLGREVWALARSPMHSGRHVVEWPGVDASGTRVRPGLYLVRVQADERRWLRRVAIIR